MTDPSTMDELSNTSGAGRSQTPADLIEATPPANAIGYWLLASPLLLFLAWLWIDLFAYLAALPWPWLNALLGVLLFVALIVLPIGYLAHRIITSMPRLFSNTGWDVQALEPVKPGEVYTTRYIVRERRRAETNWRRVLMRSGQGWVYVEVAAIFVGAIAMIPLFFSAVEFGFGR